MNFSALKTGVHLSFISVQGVRIPSLLEKNNAAPQKEDVLKNQGPEAIAPSTSPTISNVNETSLLQPLTTPTPAQKKEGLSSNLLSTSSPLLPENEENQSLAGTQIFFKISIQESFKAKAQSTTISDGSESLSDISHTTTELFSQLQNIQNAMTSLFSSEMKAEDVKSLLEGNSLPEEGVNPENLEGMLEEKMGALYQSLKISAEYTRKVDIEAIVVNGDQVTKMEYHEVTRVSLKMKEETAGNYSSSKLKLDFKQNTQQSVQQLDNTLETIKKVTEQLTGLKNIVEEQLEKLEGKAKKHLEEVGLNEFEGVKKMLKNISPEGCRKCHPMTEKLKVKMREFMSLEEIVIQEFPLKPTAEEKEAVKAKPETEKSPIPEKTTPQNPAETLAKAV